MLQSTWNERLAEQYGRKGSRAVMLECLKLKGSD